MHASPTTYEAPLRVLIVSHDRKWTAVLEQLVRQAGHEPAGCISRDRVPESVFDQPPDCILMIADGGGVDGLAWTEPLRNRLKGGLILAAEQWDQALAKTAAAAGYDAFLSIPATTVSLSLALIQADAGHRQMESLREQVADLTRRLADRKLIERAKGLLMTRKQLSEEQAFRSLRSEAMRRRISLAKLAEEVLADLGEIQRNAGQ